jgi:hypothetical protein
MSKEQNIYRFRIQIVQGLGVHIRMETSGGSGAGKECNFTYILQQIFLVAGGKMDSSGMVILW